jgi:vacuolar-type H+-ATPase subunit E/Vma4
VTELDGYPAHFNADTSGVIIELLAISDRDVSREAQRWTTGERGPIVDDPDLLAAADLTNFVIEAMLIGAHALSATGQARDSRALDQMLKDVGDKSADSTAKAAEATRQAVRDASEVVTNAADAAKKAFSEADTHTRKELTAAIASAKNDLNSEMRKILGGEHPEILDRLQPVLDSFVANLDKKANAGTSELLAKAAKQFDPTDPTSPMAKHAAELRASQEQLTAQLDKNHTDLTNKVQELSTALKIQGAKASLANVTPIKGASYEGEIHILMLDIAGGLGDEYSATSDVAGRLTRCKKGDGVLTVDDGVARVVVEMSDSPRARWREYLEEAERNREAAASLGLVRTAAQNGGRSIRVFGRRRIVMAFDPHNDDPELLRTAVMLLRTVAIAAASRNGANEIATAEEKITEAIAQLTKIDEFKKLAGSIQKAATKIDGECTNLNTGIRRLLGEAISALSGAGSAADDKTAAANANGAA